MFGPAARRISAGMRAIRVLSVALPLSLALGTAVLAAPHKPAEHHPPAGAAPKELGKFDDWTAATYAQAGQTVCYAFTRAQDSKPALPGRGQVLLTVTERPAARDSVALEAGFTFAPKAAVTVQVDQTKLDFYTADHNAFALDSKAAIAAFDRGAKAVAHMPAPHDKAVTDTFSLHGFSAAHAAILKACPAK